MKKNMIRVAAYVRVSHEDQKKFGDSIATQKQHIDNFIKANDNMVLVDWYVDEGISANKLKQRVQLQRMLDDIKAKKIDLVIFTKLDRWFRSVSKYYKIQEVLESNNVAWQAILEEYETITANGKFKVNIMLSVAQQERDRTSERIKDVFQYKISQGHAIVAKSSLPFYLTIKEIDGVKRVVKNPEMEAMTYDWIEHLKTYHSKKRACIYINDKYGKEFEYIALSRASKNEMLYGCYKGNENYCEAYMTKSEFLELQEILNKNIKVRQSNQIYILSGKIVCPVCHNHMIGRYTKYKTKDSDSNFSYHYQCNYAYHVRHTHGKNECNWSRSVSEKKIEKYLIENLKKYIERYIVEKEADIKKDAPTIDVKSIKKKLQDELDRLNKMYQKGRIDEEDYDREYDILEKKLKNLGEEKDEKVDLTKFKKMLNQNIIEQYYKLDRLQRQGFWNVLIKEIHIDQNKDIVDIIFLD